MLPREFLEKFGKIHLTEVTLQLGQFHRILPHPDRYLFSVIPPGTGVRVFPDANNTNPNIGWTINPDGPPFILTHALHGVLASSGFTIVGTGVLAPIVIIQAFARVATDTVRQTLSRPIPIIVRRNTRSIRSNAK